MAEVPEELWKLFNDTEAGALESGTVSFQDVAEAGLTAVLDRHEQMVRAKVAEEFAAYRCDYELCGQCTCRADLVKLLAGAQ